LDEFIKISPTNFELQGATAEVELKKGAKIILTTAKDFFEKGTADKVYVDYENIVNVMKKGGRIYIDDGLMSLLVDDIGMKDAVTVVCKSTLYRLSSGVLNRQGLRGVHG
jgi:pyruvate kinase